MQEKNLPIGYWLKKADEVLTNGINDIQGKYDLTRTGWQVLNSVKEEKQISREELIKHLSLFASREQIENILLKFSSEGIIEDSEKVRLTEKGLSLHESCMKEQQEFRKKTMNGITGNEYEITIKTLQKIIENLQ